MLLEVKDRDILEYTQNYAYLSSSLVVSVIEEAAAAPLIKDLLT
jgi:hypothetical protein